MKVALHVGQLFQPVPGGIGRYVRDLAHALPEANVDVLPFAATGEPFTLDGTPGWDLGHPTGRWRYELWHRFRAPRLHVDADAIHAPSLAVPPARDLPLVVTVHDVAFLRFPGAFTPRGAEFHRRGLEIAYRDAAVIITASQFARTELLRCGFDASRIHLAPHGVSVPETPPDAEVDRRVHSLGVTRPFIVAVGTIEPRKGLPTLVDAFEILRGTEPRTRLVLVGPQGWGEVRGLERLGVTRLGHVDDAALDALYRRAEVCAVPSRYEGFGLPALEAMARGCPVVASDSTSLPEVVGDAGVLVEPDDPHAWAQALRQVLQDPDESARLASAARARSARFTWAASAAAHARAYRAAMGMHNGHGEAVRTHP